ncbi:peptide chain release factor N(5)-glutamine methyltransferase [Salegentibacter chungangensis]|uniref:Release factor glutamine methyltransferase n=1 Tax=Salegentibacter chungangensis TaxID=1335724 RepID=A0ABW3NRP3_9FLAO
MKLTDLKTEFVEHLKGEYPLEEVNSFFYLLSEEYLNLNRLDFALEPGKELSEAETVLFRKSLNRLKQHEPVQYIIGATEFFGMKFEVNKNTLIPRPETEELVQWILDDHNSEEKELKLLDIGTGTGCIAISLAKHLPKAKVSAMDISKDALETARKNAEFNEVEVEFFQQDVLELEKLKEHYDIIVSNPPYVRDLEKKEMHANVLNFEPESALYVKDDDPLLFYNKITKLARQALKPAGKIYFEINQYLSEETEKLLKSEAFETELRKDIFGNYRMLKGSL